MHAEYFNNVSDTPTADQYAALLDKLRGFPGMEDSRRDTFKAWFKRQRRLALRARVVPKASAVLQPQHNLVYQSLTPDVLKNLDNVWTSVPANKRHQLYDHWTNVAYCNVGANPDDVAHWLLDRERAEA
ncbi:hypothetical protein GGX14DRAFT_401922 [Mycena pura]|uniref:Uncharacterized protein n=1 Tax=Mycena pura TaxID=153505 RepID=A0AAD6YA15_9AGAR|nr:hypothetical protein GGX14DRAFT_401922 [Mycena pura]